MLTTLLPNSLRSRTGGGGKQNFIVKREKGELLLKEGGVV